MLVIIDHREPGKGGRVLHVHVFALDGGARVRELYLGEANTKAETGGGGRRKGVEFANFGERRVFYIMAGLDMLFSPREQGGTDLGIQVSPLMVRVLVVTSHVTNGEQ